MADFVRKSNKTKNDLLAPIECGFPQKADASSASWMFLDGTGDQPYAPELSAMNQKSSGRPPDVGLPHP